MLNHLLNKPMNYIDVFKHIIKQEVSKLSGDKKFIDNLFDKIKESVIISYGPDSLVQLPEVDETTLKSYFETAKNEYLSVNPIDPGISHSLTKKGFKSWLNEEREEKIIWNYSERYFKNLKKTGRSERVVKETEDSSFSILGKMADPKSKSPIYNKGLVVGAVQSGKTGNFNAVINRAIDAGYEIVIVLAGIMEDLRSQTQERIEKDVIGEGKIDSGEPTGNLSEIEMQNLKEMKKRFKLKDIPQSNKQSKKEKSIGKINLRPMSPSKKGMVKG